MEKEEIEEESSNRVGLLKRCTTGGSTGSTRWVDGSEVDSESSQSWSLFGDEEITKQGYGSVRRRLVKKPKRLDSFDVEAMEISVAHGNHHKKEASLLSTLALAFQTLGVVYGDMGTSPLYVFSGVFSKVPITSEVDVLGALSIVLYTIALIPLMKYVFIVLKANDSGEGGTFALYSLICRYANVNLLPNRQPADEHISSFKLKLPTPELQRALNIKEVLERKSSLKTLVLLLVLMGTSMIIGDGILTPAISVMSAVSGLQGRVPGFGTNALVFTSIIILGVLFSIQRYGSSKVGFTFAPALALWFFSLGAVGVYNLLKHDVTVLRALNPFYIYLFFKKNSINGWSALGGCVLCITGAEAMFADLGHFSKVPVLQTPDGPVFESNAIARYVTKTKPNNPLFGSSLIEYAQIEQWNDFSATEIDANIARWLYPRLGYAVYISQAEEGAVAALKRALGALNTHLASNTYLVGHCITLADIIMVCNLSIGFRMILTKSFTKEFPHVERYFWTVVNQPNFVKLLGEVKQAESIPAVQSEPAQPEKLKAKEEPKEVKKEEPSPVEEEAAPKPKAKNPLDLLPPSKMILDDWKRLYSNTKTNFREVAVKGFWDMYDPEGYSLWFCEYKYNDENTVSFVTLNKVGGFLQRMELVRKYAFGKMLIVGSEAPFKVQGLWLFRGKEIPKFVMEEVYDMELYEWKEVDINDEAQKERVSQMIEDHEPFEGQALLDAKCFK